MEIHAALVEPTYTLVVAVTFGFLEDTFRGYYNWSILRSPRTNARREGIDYSVPLEWKS